MEKTLELDTAAALFPAVTRKTNTSVYRISAVLREEVDAAVLQKAAEQALKRFPSFGVTIENSAFGQCFVPNDAPLIVRRETEYPCGLIDPQQEGGFLFRILYFENRISLEAFHALADGAGAIEFLKTLLYRYFALQGREIRTEGKILLPEDSPSEEELEDSLLRYYRENDVKTKRKKQAVAFKIKGTMYEPYGNNVLQGVVPVEELKRAAKRNGATITEYLTAVLIYSIYREAVNCELDDEPIVISVPVNLRNFIRSRTLRNCFCIVNVSIPIAPHLTFDNVLCEVREQLKEKTSGENLEAAIAESCGVFQNPVVKNVPRFMREAGTKFAFAYFAENLKTMTLSNVGEVDLPEDVRPLIERVEAVIYPTERSPINCCMCSVNGKMTISFIRSIREADVIKAFFAFLTREVDSRIEIYTNDWGNDHETL